MSAVVLDASALLALLSSEPGSEAVAESLPGAQISSVNLSEVVAKLSDHGMASAEIRLVIDGLGLQVASFDEALAHEAGMLRSKIRKLGLSLGDRACLALGLRERATVLTTDRRWTEVDLAIRVQVAR